MVSVTGCNYPIKNGQQIWRAGSKSNRSRAWAVSSPAAPHSRVRDISLPGAQSASWSEHGTVGNRSSPMQAIRQLLTRLGTLAAHPTAFLIVAIYAACWFAFSPETFDWHGVTTLLVWCMTLLIQRAEHRDTQAIHAKLDELLSADKGARTAVAHVDEKEPEEIERFREQERAGQ